MTDDKSVGFCRMLDLKDCFSSDERRLYDILPPHWESLFRPVKRKEPATLVDEKNKYTGC